MTHPEKTRIINNSKKRRSSVKTNKHFRKVGTFTLVIASVFVVTVMVAQPIFAKTQSDFFRLDSSGELVRPTDYRSWVYVGTPVTPNDMNGGNAPFPEFHNVYIDPVSYQEYKQTGKFRDGTIMIKELVSVGSKQAVSGKGYFQGEFIGLEATIKSSKYFPKEPGNWAYFSFTNKEGGMVKKKAMAFPTSACNACHASAAKDDFVFTQYYPVLRAAKNAKMNPENRDERAAIQPPEVPPVALLSAEWKGTTSTPENIQTDIPTKPRALFDWLKSQKYQSFVAKEFKAHPGRGPHTEFGLPVRVFMNDVIATSKKQGKKQLPVNSCVVKEMFTKAGDLQGWAVMIKTNDDSNSGKGWFWYEVTSATDPSKIAAIGNGVPGCMGCHAAGRDMVLTSFPLK
jgi:hypothetical protein